MKDARGYNRIAAVFFLSVAVFFTLYARKVEIGTWTEPGPGFLPLWSGLTLAAMSIALFLESWAKKGWPERPPSFASPIPGRGFSLLSQP